MLCIKTIYDFNLGLNLKKKKKKKKENTFQTQTVGMYHRGKKQEMRWENANEKIVEKEISNL